MPKLEQMEIFYYVVTWKTLTRVTLELGVSKAYICTQLSALEKVLHVKLLNHSTRYLNLPEAGNVFFESCAKIVQEKQLAISLLQQGVSNPSGHLKINAPPSSCNSLLTTLLPNFQKKYPNIFLTIDS